MSSTPETIGHSTQGRPLRVHHAGSPRAATRVLVIAGQHGDERLARRAAEQWLRSFQSDDVQVAVLLDANPDGSHCKERKNAHGVDLNRDHQLLSAPETRAIHAFAQKWRPHLILDVHTYPPRRKHLLAQGLVHANDVFIDIANNPTACEQASWATKARDALPRWIDCVCKRGFRCDRYTLIAKQETVRHSTPDVIDARNGLALSLGVPTVLLEGRERTRHDDRSAKRRTIDGLVAALKTIVKDAPVRWPSKAVETSVGGIPDYLPIRSRYTRNSQQCDLEVLDPTHQEISRVRLPGPYLDQLTNSQTVRPPVSYAIPQSCAALLEVLRRHGVEAQFNQAADTYAMQTHVRQVEPSPHSRRPPRRLRTSRAKFSGELGCYATIPVTHDNARLLAVFLEAHSKYGLCRHQELGIYPNTDTPYPILRLEPRLTAPQREARRLGDAPAATA